MEQKLEPRSFKVP